MPEIAYQIVRMLQTDGYAQQILRTVRMPALDRRAMFDERFRAAERRRVRRQPQRTGERECRVATPVRAETQHRAEVAHLPRGDRMTRMRRQAGPVHLGDAGVRREELG